MLEIIACLLSCLEETPLKKTHLTCKANVDSRTASKYISFLLEFQLLERSKADHTHFTITEKGRNFLRNYRGVLEALGTSEELEINMEILNRRA